MLNPVASTEALPVAPAAHPARPWTFDAVYDGHFAFVWRTVRRLGVHESQVDDAVQDVFLVVHRRLSEFEGPSPRAWLFSIVARVVREKRRTLRRKPANLGSPVRSSDDVETLAIADPQGALYSPQESAAWSEAVEVLHSILDAMPDARREIFVLSELEQMTCPEIAVAVGVNVNTVYSRLRAARADFERAVARVRAGDEWRLR